MAIQLRRGHQGDLDITKLLPGEAAVCLDTGKVIVKLAGGNYLTLTDTPELRAIVDGKVDAEPNKGLSTNDYTTAEKTKLGNIEAGAQVNVKPNWNAASGSAAEILNKPTIPNYSAATTSAAGLMSATDKAKLDNVNAGQMAYLSESTAKILTDSPRSLSESLLNYKIIEVRCLQLEETISGTTYQSWGWARLIKKSSGDFMSTPVIHFISNDSTLTIRAYEIGILSANPTQLALTRDTSGVGLWTGTIIGYK